MALDGSRILGCGSIRECHPGFKIGPLNAQSPELARRIFSALCGGVPGGAPVYLDVPEPNKDAVKMAEAFGMHPIFETARMYNKEAPPLPLEKIYGITTFELG